MTTTTPEPQGSQDIPWWERLTDASGDSEASRGVLRMIVIAAVLGGLAIVAFNFFKGSQAEEANTRSGAIEAAQGSLPLCFSPREVTDPYNPNPVAYSRRNSMGALGAYILSGGAPSARGRTSAALMKPEDADEFRKKVEGEIAALKDKKGEFEGTDQEYMYWHSLQCLHFFAARNSTDIKDVERHIEEQKTTLSSIESKFGSHAFFSMRPNTDFPEKNIITLWREVGEKELAFRKQMTDKVAVNADQELKATLTLDDGKTVELEFFSVVAPKSVASFVANATGGFYDGTAVSRVDSDGKVLTLGNPFTKSAADRPFLWDRTQELYTVPVEQNLLLPVKKGCVTLRPVGAAANGFEFDIHFEDPEEGVMAPVFARVTSGLDDLRSLLESEVQVSEKLSNAFLPKARIGLKSVVVVGQPQHKGLDVTWAPTPKAPEAPEANEDEKAFMDELAGGGDEDSSPDDTEKESGSDN